jgi:hypothetical protein
MVLTCTASSASIPAGTVLSDVTVTVDIASAALGTLQTVASLADGGDAAATASATAAVDVTAAPVLDLSTSGTPPTAPAGSTYTLGVSVSLSSSGGPAYGEPTLTFVMPAGETFVAAPTVPGWNCSLTDGATALSCVRTATTPVDPGAALVSLSVQVRVSSTASGDLAASVSAGDTADGAVEAVSVTVTTVPVETPDTGTPAGTPWPWALGALLVAAGLLLVACEARRRRSCHGTDRA